MAHIIPFKAFRSSRDKVHLVASRSYISYKPSDLTRKLDENPFTFLHILNPEYKVRKTTKANSEARFLRVKNKFDEFVDLKYLDQDQQNNFYLYEQIKDGHSYLGIIGCASSEDYYADVIKKHEATISKRESMFKNYLKATEINAEPVCFTYPNHAEIDRISLEVQQKRPEYDFTTTNRVQHRLWLIDEATDIKNISKAFSEIPSIYIADGHHRSASSALMGKELASKNPQHTGHELYNFFMGLFIPSRQLKIFAFNRLVKDLGVWTQEAFLKEVEKSFEIEKRPEAHFKPSSEKQIGMYIQGQWFCLRPKADTLNRKDLVESLDVSILTDEILAPILGIHDLRTDHRISFKGELEGLGSLEKEVNEGRAAIAFAHYPVSMETLIAISDAGKIMPPKSTWIEPKLRSGLTVFSTDEKHR